MKKIFFTLCALCVSVSMWALADGQSAWTDTNRADVQLDENSGLYFYVTGSGDEAYASITWTEGAENGGNNYSSITAISETTLPESVSYGGVSYPVTRIAPFAFYQATTIKSVVIPAYITAIGSNAFEDCTGIEEVTIEYSATTLQDENAALYSNMFYNNTSLKTVTLNRNVQNGRSSMACAAFSYQHTITTIMIGAHVGEIPDFMFRDDKQYHYLTSVTCYATYPPTMNNSYNPFDRDYSSAGSVPLYVPSGYEQLYMEDTAWATVFGTNVNAIDGYTPEVEQPEGTLMDVDTHLFFEMNSDGKTVSIIADPVETYTDTHLVYVEDGDYYTFPETVTDKSGVGGNVTRIEASAFENSGISGHLYIPAFITAMGEKAFMNSTKITEVTYEYSATALKDESSGNNTGTESFNGCTGVTTVNLYRNIEAGHSSNICTPFAYHAAISTINIGPRVTEIPHHMFNTNNSSYSLKTINCYAAVPPTLGNATFRAQYLNSGFVVNVPSGAKEAYLSDTSTYSWPSMFAYDNSGYTLEGHIAELSNAYAVNITLTNNDGYYYATYYNSNAVDIYPQGGTDYDVTSYAVSGVTVEDEDEGYLDLAEVGATVPAKTAVLVEATAEGTYTVIETTAATSASYTGTNDLYGYDTATAVTDNSSYYYYTLSHPSGGGSLGFYWATSDGSANGFTSAAHKAYLMLLKSEVANLKSISLRKGDGAGDTTGITSVEVENEPNTVKGIYTLQGVRVSNMNQPGLYIVDGKKVLVK